MEALVCTKDERKQETVADVWSLIRDTEADATNPYI